MTFEIFIFKVRFRICDYYLKVIYYLATLVSEEYLKNITNRQFRLNALQIKKTLLRESPFFRASFSLGLFKRCLARQIKNKITVGDRFAICRLRGIGDSLVYFHSIYLLEKKSNQKFQFLGVPLFPHFEIIRFLFGENRIINEVDFLAEVIKENPLQDSEQKPKETRFENLIYKFSLECLEKFIPENMLLNLETCEDSWEGLNHYSREYQKRYENAKNAAVLCQVFQGHISYIKDYEELFEVCWRYPGENKEKVRKLHKALKIRKPYICLQIRNNITDSNRSSTVLNSESYHLGIKSLVKRGYQIVLIGPDAPDFEFLDSISDSNAIIRYGKSAIQNIENDLLIVSECELFIGCCSGPTNYAHLFKKPVLVLNYTTFGLSTLLFNHRFYSKNYSWIGGKELSLKEILASPIVFSLYNDDAEKLNIELKYMSEVEIVEAINEFVDNVEKPDYSWKNLSFIQKRYREHLDPAQMIGYYSKGAPLNCWCKRMHIIK